jgi:hypothetical protein
MEKLILEVSFEGESDPPLCFSEQSCDKSLKSSKGKNKG